MSKAQDAANNIKELRDLFEKSLTQTDKIELVRMVAPAIVDDLILHLDLFRQRIRRERAERKIIHENAGKCSGCKWLAEPYEIEQLKGHMMINQDSSRACMALICRYIPDFTTQKEIDN